MARRARALALAVVLAGAAAPAEAAPDRTPPAAPDRTASGDAQVRTSQGKATQWDRKTVTLVTGDRVVLDGDRLVSVTPGAHRKDVSFQVTRHAGRLRVVPTDVASALAEGRVDQRLFDVTGLVEAGYDDARRDTVPVIVSGGRPPSGARVAGALPAVDAVAAEVSKATGWLELPEGGGKVWLDGVARPLLDRSTTQVGAPAAWAAGLTGAGVTVAVVDTGVDGDHPDLVGREVAGRDFTHEQDGIDRYGHGTHVAATIAGHRAPYRGVAPDARLLDAKVCDAAGLCPESAIIEGMRWAAEQGADVVNISLGLRPSDDVDPVEAAVDALSASHGTLFVVSAGNDGDGAATVLSPGTADSALTVGAVERDDSLAEFSSRGPRVADGAVKPDITAPGVDIVAAKSSAGGLLGTPVGDRHMALSGTSMASPHVAGAAALLAQRHPDWGGARLKASLTASARPNPALSVYEQGSGRLDIAAALSTTVTSEPTSVTLGLHEWPHGDDVPVTKPLVYRNDGTQPITLDLNVRARGPDGAEHPVFSVSPARITVAAGGTAEVAVTGDSRQGSVDGAYSGTVVAMTGGAEVLRTPVGLDREVESYPITFDYPGTPEGKGATTVVNLATGVGTYVRDNTARLPKGNYVVQSLMGPEMGPHTIITQPDLRVEGATRVVLDARSAGPLEVVAPDPAAVPDEHSLAVDRRSGDDAVSMSVYYPGAFPAGTRVGHAGPSLPAGELDVFVSASSASPSASYWLGWTEQGRVPDGFVRRPRESDLARVRTTVALKDLGGLRELAGYVVAPSGEPGPAFYADVSSTPTSTRYTTPRTTWQTVLFDEGGLMNGNEERYGAGRTYDRSFGAPVIGPVMYSGAYPNLTRAGNEVAVSLSLFGDREGNEGYSRTTSARTALYRDGKLVGENDSSGHGAFAVPPGPAVFRVRTEVTRAPEMSDFSTRIVVDWTFRSNTTTRERRLPMSVVRFTPELDHTGSAPANRPLTVPLVVDGQRGVDNAPLRNFRVEVSYDDGASWGDLPVLGRSALVGNRAMPGTFASLRVHATDDRGGALSQTVIRAYRLG
ncbi:subtilisin family serine protease [Saccharothrix ecbatanensis]|uniref:Subtilisin family serine protease n=1 Tax=Saccharothrix ecbatanensis TaxID=1105145 RepID=A0A7W9LZS0_9PSEU|nr:S8 family serine peptidase [Saccharothrix ecbatanensis]MBB5802002.1 subtilisin family serine protease [Saccharothrix ecbatanensis]